MPGLLLILAAAVAFLFGSVPWSLLIARWAGGIDLRLHGSGNVGATNVTRTLGLKWGLLALFFDAIKGLTPVLVLPLLLRVPESLETHVRVVSAVAAVVGHMFPPWLRFRGGKGMATSFGAVIALAPWGCLWAFGGFALTMGLTRIVSLSSIVAVITFAAAQLATYGAALWTPSTWSLGAFSIAVPLLILFQHRANIGRIVRGEEKPLSLRPRPPSEGKGEPAPTRSEPDGQP